MEELPPNGDDEPATEADRAVAFGHADDDWWARVEMMDRRLAATFRGELSAALTRQSRAILVSNVASFVAGGSFVLAAAHLL